jgi:uncharacterized repeat protein (TIGR02543 family)
MKLRTSQGFLALLIVSLWSCVNPFFASLNVEEKIGVVSSDSPVVIFKMNDGTETNWAALAVIAGTSVPAGDFPADPERPGSVFAHWNTAADGTGTVFTASTTVSGDMTVYAQWNPEGSEDSDSSLVISLQPEPGAPPLADERTCSVGDEVAFSAAGDYASWEWRWDGKLINGEETDAYVLTAVTAGIYELTVVATTGGGAQLSARCRVTIKAK